MKNFKRILLAALLAMALVVVGAISVAAEGTALELGENTVAAGTEEEPATYLFTAAEEGTYTFTVTGTANYQVGPMGATTCDLQAGDVIGVNVGAAEGEVVITVVKEAGPVEPECTELEVGVTENVAVAGADGEGTTVRVIATEAGRYTLTTDNANVLVGVLTDILDYETKYVDVEVKGTAIYFVLTTENFQNDTATVTVTVSEIPEEPATVLEVGENKDVAIAGFGTTVQVIATEPGRYTVTAADANVIVAAMDMNGNIDYETNYVDVEVKGTPVYFVLATEDFADATTTVTVAVSEIPEEPATVLEVGENKDVAVAAAGTLVQVIATEPGRYTVTAEGVKVGAMDMLGNINYEEAYVDVEVKGTPVYFVLCAEEDTTVTVTVAVGEIPAEEATFVEIGENKDVAIAGKGTLIQVIPTKPGRYTVKVNNEKVAVGALNLVGDIDYEVDYIDVASKGDGPIYFILCPEDYEDTTVTVTVEVEEVPVTGDFSMIIPLVIAMVSLCGIVICKKISVSC